MDARFVQGSNITYPDHMLRARLGGKHAEDTGTAADIEHELVLEQVGVLDDRVAVRARAHSVLEHLLVDSYSRVFATVDQ